MTIRFGSLFAGIGGFDLGFERAGMKCAWQVEIDSYANQVLHKHWPDVPRWRDVRTFPPRPLAEWKVDVICGGFPCQDISYAGRGAGITGERSRLFFETIRVVRQLRPRIVVLENVAALLTRGLDAVLGSLAEIGFNAEWHCIPAGVFGAHFVGDRIFVLAEDSAASSLRRQGSWTTPLGSNQWGRDEFERLVRLEVQHGVPAGSFGRVSDGVSNRVDRLRGLGNAVVPQVAEYIGGQVVNVLTAKRLEL